MSEIQTFGFRRFPKLSHSQTVPISDVRLIDSTNWTFGFRTFLLLLNDQTNRTALLSEIWTSEIRTKFCSVFQTKRLDFGHLLYGLMQVLQYFFRWLPRHANSLSRSKKLSTFSVDLRTFDQFVFSEVQVEACKSRISEGALTWLSPHQVRIDH